MKNHLCTDQRIILVGLLLLVLTTGFQSTKETEKIIHNSAYATDQYVKVLFDEAHYNFHTSTGRYKPFTDVLRQDGYSVTPNTKKITMEVLKGYHLFVCANAFSSGPDSSGRLSPDLAFTAEECHHLKRWVWNGGSIWLIADHEPAGNAVENLADSLGVNVSKSYTADPKNFEKAILDASWIRYSTANSNLGDHPIINGRNETERVKTVLSFTGQSLKGPQHSVPFLKLSDEAYDVLNIEDRRNAKIISAKGRCQALAMEFGKGRIVVCGEAAMFTSQHGDDGINYPGVDNRQLLLNIAHWLSKQI